MERSQIAYLSCLFFNNLTQYFSTGIHGAFDPWNQAFSDQPSAVSHELAMKAFFRRLCHRKPIPQIVLMRHLTALRSSLVKHYGHRANRGYESAAIAAHPVARAEFHA
jgi:hypothetical protein